MAVPVEDIVAGLAKTIERHGRRLDGQADLIQTLAEQVKEVVKRSQAKDQAEDSGSPRVCWLTLDDPTVALIVMQDLIGWLEQVWCRYPDGALPGCWLWHPWVVEELLALRHSHLAAYSDRGRPKDVVEWHERQRPAVADRIAKKLATCGLERHTDAPLAVVPLAASGDRLAPQWALSCHPRAVEPPTELELADAARYEQTVRTRRERRVHTA